MILFESNNNLVLQKVSDKKLIMIGIENTIVVETEDAILICDNAHIADVKKYTNDL